MVSVFRIIIKSRVTIILTFSAQIKKIKTKRNKLDPQDFLGTFINP